MKLIEAVGIRIRTILSEKNDLTLYELAKQAGMPKGTVWKILNPDLTRVKTMKLDTLYQILDTLNIKLKDFFDDPIFDKVDD